MGVVALAWCLGGLSALLAVMTSAITYAPPGPGAVERALPAVFGCGTVLAVAAAAGLGWLPPTHRVRQSRSLRAGFVAATVAAAALVVLLG